MPIDDPEPWPTYWRELHDFIANPANGLLLDAETDYDADGQKISTPRAAFRLTSGRYRRFFISLWELFDHPKEFGRCIGMLARKAIAISREHHFDTIVTCTHTARELVHHVEPLIEEEMKQELGVSEFGHYPWRSTAEVESEDFNSRSVLIFTDVMASGSLVRDMASRIIRAGGDVVAVLCVVVSDDGLCAEFAPGRAIDFDLEHGVPDRTPNAPIYTLGVFPIRDLDADEFDEKNVRRIDFVSAYPEISPTTSPGFVPLVSSSEMFRHFHDSGSLAFGFYKDRRFVSLAIRVQSLLTQAGDIIWSRIENHMREDAVLVSTFKKDDLRFSHFVQERLQRTGRPIEAVVLKREQGDSAHLHQALFGQPPRLHGRHVVLLRAADTTSEELRALTALLAGEHVASIAVLCLVNRMGPFTVSFVNRIQQLVTGVLTKRRSGGDVRVLENGPSAVFNFIPVYTLLDLRTDDLARMHEHIAGVVRKFQRWTRVEHFKHLAETFGRLMAPRSIHTWAFESGRQDSVAQGMTGPFATAATEATRAEAMASVVSEFLSCRTRDKLIDAIKETWQPDVFLYATGLAIADIDYMRLSGNLSRLIHTLWARLRELRDFRFQSEAESNFPEPGSEEDEELRGTVAYCLHLEIHLLFSLGLLAHFDKTIGAESDILTSVLFADRAPAIWHQHPINLGFHFRDVRNYGLAVFLIHAVSPTFSGHSPSAAGWRPKAVAVLRTNLEALLLGFSQEDTENVDSDVTVLVGRIRELMDLLLVECHVYTQREWHHRLRYLHRYILRDLQQHSAIFTALTRAEEDFRKSFRNRSASLDARIPRRVQEALMATLTLREVAKVARQLSNYPSHFVSELLQNRFSDFDGPNSFMVTVARLANWLMGRQSGPPESESEIAEYERLVQEVQLVIFEPGCALRKALAYFVVSLNATLYDALLEAAARLKAKGINSVWDREIARFDSLQQGASEMLVLVDPLLLREVLRNILFNVRYTLESPDARTNLERVSIEIGSQHNPSPPPEFDSLEFITLKIEAQGKTVSDAEAPRPPNQTTMADHQARIREFGGTLTIRDRIGGTGSSVELKLISRQAYQRHYGKRDRANG